MAAPVITITPAAGAKHVRPDLPIRILAQDGRLTDVTVRTSGRDVAGRMNPQTTQWISRWALTPGARYVVQATARNSAGKIVTATSKFRTLSAGNTFSASLDWTLAANQGQPYGVGLPIIVNFSQPVQNKAAVQKALVVTAQNPVPGAWRWVTDEQIVYRA
ncbi:MAG TPA: Ig-like domain-containing protein, partial [Streptosporangiaceae bacterium]